MNKKAQLTIFFMLGLVILITIMLLFFARSETTPQQVQTTTSIQAEQYLQACMTNALHNWLDELQDPQNTVVWLQNPQPEITNSTDLGVTTNLSEALGYEDINKIYDYSMEGDLFGVRTHPALCDPQGPNNQTQTTHSRCKTYGPNSLQANLTQEIRDALNNCQNVQDIDLEVGADLSAWGLADVEIILTTGSTIISARYAEATIQQNYPIRLLTLYNLVHERITFTSLDPRITIQNMTHAQLSNYYTSTRTIERERPNNNQYTYRFRDESSTFAGKYLEISFFAQERPTYEDLNGVIYDPN